MRSFITILHQNYVQIHSTSFKHHKKTRSFLRNIFSDACYRIAISQIPAKYKTYHKRIQLNNILFENILQLWNLRELSLKAINFLPVFSLQQQFSCCSQYLIITSKKRFFIIYSINVELFQPFPFFSLLIASKWAELYQLKSFHSRNVVVENNWNRGWIAAMADKAKYEIVHQFW